MLCCLGLLKVKIDALCVDALAAGAGHAAAPELTIPEQVIEQTSLRTQDILVSLL